MKNGKASRGNESNQRPRVSRYKGQRISIVGVNPKIGGKFSPKMDGENNGSKPYEQMDDLGVPLFLETPI